MEQWFVDNWWITLIMIAWLWATVYVFMASIAMSKSGPETWVDMVLLFFLLLAFVPLMPFMFLWEKIQWWWKNRK